MLIPILGVIVLATIMILLNRKKSKKYADSIIYKIYSIVYFGKNAAFFKAHNKIRLDISLKPLIADKEADARANNRVNELIKEYKEKGTISHLGFGDDAGIIINLGADSFGENIAFGYTTVTGAMNAFVNSAGHYKNIINPKYDFVGVAHGENNGRMFWVAFFGGEDKI